MWLLFGLCGLNALVWSLPIVIGLSSHFAPIGANRFWWFDDLPWASVGLTAVLVGSSIALGVSRRPILRRVMTTVAALGLCAFVPWV